MSSESPRPVRPVSPPAAYLGGKRMLSSRLVDLIDHTPHKTYAEPFVGMGGVFLRRHSAPPCEVMNDISGEVVNLFRILQRHYVPLMDMLRFQFTSRREFARLLAVPPATLTDLERAARFLYLQRTAFGGKVRGQAFGVSVGIPGRFDVLKLQGHLADISERLSGVVIENLHYGEMLRRYDSDETLFYLDPPYWGSETDYGRDVFEPADFERLAEQLAGIAGAFILSLNDTAEVRRIFAAFEFEAVDVTYTISDGAGVAAKEVIITSHGLRERRRGPQPGLFE